MTRQLVQLNEQQIKAVLEKNCVTLGYPFDSQCELVGEEITGQIRR